MLDALLHTDESEIFDLSVAPFSCDFTLVSNVPINSFIIDEVIYSLLDYDENFNALF